MPALTNRQEVYVTYLASAALQPQRGLAPDEERMTWGRVVLGQIALRRTVWAAMARAVLTAVAEVRSAGITRENCASLATARLL